VRGDSSVHVPYGILQIGTVLKQKGHDVKVIDPLFDTKYLTLLRKFNPDVVGLSYISYNFNQTKKLVSKIKKINKKSIIIAGGPHATYKPEEAIKELKIDVAVVGEADLIIPNLLKELEKKQAKNLEKVKGVVFKNEQGKLVRTPPENIVKKLDDTPFADYSFFDMEKYLIPPGYIRSLFLNRVITMYTSRGCSYSCQFCGIPAFFSNKLRFRSIERVIGHIKMLIDAYKIDGINFSDEVLTINKKNLIFLGQLRQELI